LKIAFILFDNLTILDFVGFYEPFIRLKTMGFKEDMAWDFCGTAAEIRDDGGLTFKANRVRPDLSGYDLLFVPGGLGTRALRQDPDFLQWFQSARAVPYKVSVCTGSLLLGAAGFLQGKRATTHPGAYDLLAPYCQEVVRERIVQDGRVFTGGGVASSLDLGLYMCEYFGGREAAGRIQKQMDYPYYAGGMGAEA
jgi:transcriptional regulator GlxA family with amidase domain